MACHTAQDGKPYAGGNAIATPFGTMYGPNLTPDDGTGLGKWSADDFWRALHNGIAPDGRLPLNTSGGNLAECYMHGLELVHDAVRHQHVLFGGEHPAGALAEVWTWAEDPRPVAVPARRCRRPRRCRRDRRRRRGNNKATSAYPPSSIRSSRRSG